MTMNDETDRADQRKALDQFANAAGQSNQPQPHGHALVRPTTGISERIVGAQHVAVYRDEAKIFQKLSSIAAAAGNDWFYRYPVRNNTTGKTDYIEGPSIKLANDVARIFGNNANEVREIDVGDAWIFYARFTDLETGFSMERAYRQRKGQTSMKTKDPERQLDIAYQIGQSKAIRNCIVNSLQLYADFAFEEARNSLVDKIGKDLEGWKARTVQGIAKIPVELARVERVVGRSAANWLAPDVAQVIAMMKAYRDGMATLDETFPPVQAGTSAEAEQQDKTTSTADTSEQTANESQTENESESTEGETAGAETATETQQAAPASQQETAAPKLKGQPKTVTEYQDMARRIIANATDRDQLRSWFVGDAQRKLRNACGLISAESDALRAEIEAKIRTMK
jgi:hypothetical protein